MNINTNLEIPEGSPGLKKMSQRQGSKVSFGPVVKLKNQMDRQRILELQRSLSKESLNEMDKDVTTLTTRFHEEELMTNSLNKFYKQQRILEKTNRTSMPSHQMSASKGLQQNYKYLTHNHHVEKFSDRQPQTYSPTPSNLSKYQLQPQSPFRNALDDLESMVSTENSHVSRMKHRQKSLNQHQTQITQQYQDYKIAYLQNKLNNRGGILKNPMSKPITKFDLEGLQQEIRLNSRLQPHQVQQQRWRSDFIQNHLKDSISQIQNTFQVQEKVIPLQNTDYLSQQNQEMSKTTTKLQISSQQHNLKLFDETFQSRAQIAQSKTISIHQNDSQVLMASMDLIDDQEDQQTLTMRSRKTVQFDMSQPQQVQKNSEPFSLKNLKYEMQEVEKKQQESQRRNLQQFIDSVRSKKIQKFYKNLQRLECKRSQGSIDKAQPIHQSDLSLSSTQRPKTMENSMGARRARTRPQQLGPEHLQHNFVNPSLDPNAENDPLTFRPSIDNNDYSESFMSTKKYIPGMVGQNNRFKLTNLRKIREQSPLSNDVVAAAIKNTKQITPKSTNQKYFNSKRKISQGKSQKKKLFDSLFMPVNKNTITQPSKYLSQIQLQNVYKKQCYDHYSQMNDPYNKYMLHQNLV